MTRRGSVTPSVVLAGFAVLLASSSAMGLGNERAVPKKIVSANVSAPVSPVLSPPLRTIPVSNDPTVDHVSVPNIDFAFGGRFGVDHPVRPDPVIQSFFGFSAPSPTGINFDGIRAGGSAPPDNDGKVGPNHYVQWVNSRFAIYDKTGSLLYGPTSGNSLFATLGGTCAAHNDGDPIVEYDLLADRWMISQFAVGGAPDFSHQCVAMSVTGDPLGSYFLYDFVTHSANFVDYPHIGVWPDAYYMTSHVFNGAGTAFLNQGLHAMERQKMLAGLPARILYADMTNNFFGALPADLDSLTPPPAAAPETVMAFGSPFFDGSATTVLHVWQIVVDWSASPSITVNGPTDVPVPAFNEDMCNFSRNCVPQSGTTTTVDAISGRLMYRLAYRNFGAFESLVVNHTVNVAAPSGHAVNQAAPRWYEVRAPSAPTLFQSGTFAPDAAYRWMASIAMDNSGDIALGYSKSSSSIFPEIDITGRLVGDPAGTMGSEAVVKAGAGNQNGGLNRWGDYTDLTVDPRDGCTFWYTNQYQQANGSFNWFTRTATFRFPSCVGPLKGTIRGSVTNASTGLPVASALVSVSNGFSGMTDVSGNYTIVLPPGSYSVQATSDQRLCAASSSQNTAVVDGTTSVLNFTLTGSPQLALGPITVDDSAGNGNGQIDFNECAVIEVPLSNTGCATDTAISAVLSTVTAGVTVQQPTSPYPNIHEGQTSLPVDTFQITTSPSFVCGTAIAFQLDVTDASGPHVFNFSVPTCQAPFSATGVIDGTDPSQNGRVSRNGVASVCGVSKAFPGVVGAGTGRNYDTYTLTNTDSAAHCVTVTLSPNCAGENQIYATAYLGSFDPANIGTNFLGDLGLSPTNGGPGRFAVTVPAGATFVIVVNEINQGTGCTNYQLRVDGLLESTDGGRQAAPTASNDGPVCQGDTLHLTATTVPGATYLWTGPNGFTSTSQNPQIVGVTPAATGTYSVTATVGSCTTDAGLTSPVVKPTPATPAATNGGDICAGNTLSLFASTVPGATYVWSGPNGFISGLQNPTIPSATIAASGTYSVTATVSGCVSAAGTTTVTVGAIPGAPVASNNGPVCAGSTLQLSATAFPGATYSWTGPNGFTSNQLSPVIPNVTSAAAGIYSVMAIVNGCPSPAGTTTVAINPGPSAAITAPLSVDPASLANAASVPDAGAGATYTWTIRGGTITGGAATRSITFTPGAAGPSLLNVTVTTPSGCSTSSKRVVPVVSGDFDSNVKTDIVWHNVATGQSSIWLMNGTTAASVAGLPTVTDTAWEIEAIGDFNGDGKADLVWRHLSDGINVIWLMNGTVTTSVIPLNTQPDTNWRIAAAADMDGDGKPDLLWHNIVTGQNTIWLMNGTTPSSVVILPTVVDTGYYLAGVGDFNGDGWNDIIWRNPTTGLNSIWFMNGTSVASVAALTTVPGVDWRIVGTGDYDQDGKPDLLWRNRVNGLNAVWIMNGVTPTSIVSLPPQPDGNWTIAGPR